MLRLWADDQAIQLNLVTFSPELKVALGQITSKSEAGLDVEQMKRDEEMDGEDGAQLHITIKELQERQGEWKIVKHAPVAL